MALAAGFAPGALASTAGGATQASAAYVQADYALVRHADATAGVARAAIAGVLEGARLECPQAGARSPQDAQSTQMSDEVIGAMVLSAIHHEFPQIHAFLRAVAPLRWSVPAVGSAVISYERKLSTMASLSVPPLCADVRAWAADGFSALPAGTVSFDARFMPAWVAVGDLPGALARLEAPGTRALAASAVRLEERIAEFEAGEVETWGHIMNALELWP
jgi:hypothetical protein